MEESTNKSIQPEVAEAQFGVMKKLLKIFVAPRRLFESVKDENFIQTFKYFVFLLTTLIIANFIFQFLLGSLIMKTVGPTFAAASSYLGSFLGVIYIPLIVIPFFIVSTITLFLIFKILRVNITFYNCFKALVYSATPALFSVFLFFAFFLLFFLLAISAIYSFVLLIIGLRIFIDGSRVRIWFAAIASNIISLIAFPVIMVVLLYAVPKGIMQHNESSNLAELNEQKLDFVCKCGVGFNIPEKWEIDKDFIRGNNLSGSETKLKLKNDTPNSANDIYVLMYNKLPGTNNAYPYDKSLSAAIDVNTRIENRTLANGTEVKKEIADYFKFEDYKGTEAYREYTLLKFKSGRKAKLDVTCELQRKDECLKEIDYIINSFKESE
ncbi:MAG: Yip1 family protein [bacterium]